MFTKLIAQFRHWCTHAPRWMWYGIDKQPSSARVRFIKRCPRLALFLFEPQLDATWKLVYRFRPAGFRQLRRLWIRWDTRHDRATWYRAHSRSYLMAVADQIAVGQARVPGRFKSVAEEVRRGN